MSGLPAFEFRLADRYLAEECTPEERARVARLIADGAAGWHTIAELHEAFAVRTGQRAPEVREARARLGVHIAMSDAVAIAQTATRGTDDQRKHVSRAMSGMWKSDSFRAGVHPMRPRTWYALTGIVFAGAVIMFGWGGNAVRSLRQKQVPMLVYATGNGQRANIILSDGTLVSLNVASHLEVPADYLTGNHALRLRGEALFTVSHHDRKPFTVTAGNTTTGVLGTSFVVRHYATDTTTMVAVRDGKVMVHAQVVPAGRQVDVNLAGLVRTRHADPAQFSFAAGVLTLNSVALSDAIPELNRWYDAEIRLGDTALASQRLTGEYVTGSVADLSNILELTFNVRAVRDGRVLTLYAR